MTRPTTHDLVDATEDLEVLAYAHDPSGSPRNNSGFPTTKTLLSLRAWVEEEIKAAERGAAYGQGNKDGYLTLQKGGSPADIDTRTHDQHAKNLRNLRAAWNVEDQRIAAERMQEAMDVGRYPTRSEQAAG